jgi:hypothetical protein
MKSAIPKYGFQSGLYVGLFLILSIFLTMPKIGILQAFSSIIFLSIPVITFFFVKNFRIKQNNDSLTFGEGFMLSWIILLVAGLVYVIVQFVYMKYINPGMQIEMLEAGQKALERQNAPAESYKIMESIITPAIISIWIYLFLCVIGGAITSLIIAAFAQKKEDPFKPKQYE